MGNAIFGMIMELVGYVFDWTSLENNYRPLIFGAVGAVMVVLVLVVFSPDDVGKSIVVGAFCGGVGGIIFGFVVSVLT